MDLLSIGEHAQQYLTRIHAAQCSKGDQLLPAMYHQRELQSMPAVCNAFAKGAQTPGQQALPCWM